MRTKLIIPFLVSLACVAITSCGTMAGMGKDISSMSRSVKNKATGGTWGSQPSAYQTPAYGAPAYGAPAYGATDYGPADYPPPR